MFYFPFFFPSAMHFIWPQWWKTCQLNIQSDVVKRMTSVVRLLGDMVSWPENGLSGSLILQEKRSDINSMERNAPSRLVPSAFQWMDGTVNEYISFMGKQFLRYLRSLCLVTSTLFLFIKYQGCIIGRRFGFHEFPFW